MRWILDDGPFGHLAAVVELDRVSEWELGVLVVAEATADAASPRSRALLEARRAAQPVIATFKILLGAGDPAEVVLGELHPDVSSTTNLAEHESIAWALAHGSDTVFVSADKRAVLIALAELGRHRVAHAFDVWIDLKQRGWLSSETFSHLCELTHKHDQGLPRLPSRVAEFLTR